MTSCDDTLQVGSEILVVVTYYYKRFL